jgi:hypothetical protein
MLDKRISVGFYQSCKTYRSAHASLIVHKKNYVLMVIQWPLTDPELMVCYIWLVMYFGLALSSMLSDVDWDAFNVSLTVVLG